MSLKPGWSFIKTFQLCLCKAVSRPKWLLQPAPNTNGNGTYMQASEGWRLLSHSRPARFLSAILMRDICGKISTSLPCEQRFSFFNLLSTISARKIQRLRLPVETHGQLVSKESFKQRLLSDSLRNLEIDCLCFKQRENELS